MNASAQPSFSLMQSGLLARECCHPQWAAGLLTSISLVKIAPPPRHAQKSISQVVPEPIKLAVEINYHGGGFSQHKSLPPLSSANPFCIFPRAPFSCAVGDDIPAFEQGL